jgi:hypothetical protein
LDVNNHAEPPDGNLGRTANPGSDNLFRANREDAEERLVVGYRDYRF